MTRAGAALALLVAACGAKHAGPRCEELRPMVDRMYALAMRDLGGGMTPRERQLAADATAQVAGPLKEAIVTACRDDKWPVEVVTCMAAATDEPSLDDCEARLDATARAHVEQAMTQVVTSIEPPTPPAEDGDGDAEGDDLGIGESGLPACDAYAKALEAYFDCDVIPDAVKRSARSGLITLRRTWSLLKDPSTGAAAKQAAADACTKARVEIETSARAQGCDATRDAGAPVDAVLTPAPR